MVSQFPRAWPAALALLMLTPPAVTGSADSANNTTSAWQRIELPIDSDGRLCAAVFRDTLFVGGDAGAGRPALCGVPLDSPSRVLTATECRIQPELRIKSFRSLVSLGDSLIALCVIDADDSRSNRALFVYDGDWRRFPLMPDGFSFLFSGLHVAGRTLCASGRFHGEDRSLREFALSWSGGVWQPLGLRLDLAYRGDLLEFGCDLVAVVCRGDSELGDDWLRRGFHRQQVLGWDGRRWRTLFTGRGGRLSSPVVHQGALCMGQTPGWNDEVGQPAVVRLENGELRRLGGAFGLTAGPDARVEHLAVYRGRLVAAGSFDHVGEASVDDVVFWDGGTWWALGAFGDEVDPDFLVAEERGLWCGGRRAGSPRQARSAALFRWAGPLLRSETPMVHAPPARAVPILPAVADTLLPFGNGDFARWRGDVPVGWKLFGKFRKNGDDAMYGLAKRSGGGVIMRPDSADTYGMSLAQSFRVEPGRFYRVRIRAHHIPGAGFGRAPACRLQYKIGPRTEFLDLPDNEDFSSELTMMAPAGAGDGSVVVLCSSSTAALEVTEVVVEEVPFGFGDCYDRLVEEFDAHYAFPGVSRAEWNETVAELRPAAWRAVNSQAFWNILHALLASLRDAEIRTVENSGDVSRIGVIYGGEDIPPPQSSGCLPGPNERLLRLPCGMNIIYRAW